MIGSNERVSLDLANANGVWSLWTFADFESDGITVGNFSGNFGDVHEEIVATLNFNKSESFYLVKPLDSSLRHVPVSMHQVLEEDGWGNRQSSGVSTFKTRPKRLFGRFFS